MSLQKELDALRAEFVRAAPPDRAELYDAKVEELQRTFPIGKALKTGDQAPDFTLPNPSGRPVSLSGLLRGGCGRGNILSRRLVPLLQPSASRLSAGPQRDHGTRRQARRDIAATARRVAHDG